MTPKQERFARFYAKSQNAKQAALAAGYSEHYANTKGPKKLLEHVEVLAEIKRVRARLNETADKSATDVVNEFSKIAFTDRVDFLKEDPYYPGEFVYKSPDELTPDQRHIVERVTYTLHEIVVIRDEVPEKLWIKHYVYVLSDKAKALEQMGRHFGIFDDKLKLVGNQQNPFKNASPAQLEKLRKTVIQTMTDPVLLEGNYKEVKNG
jgi:phage terminase small subunit